MKRSILLLICCIVLFSCTTKKSIDDQNLVSKLDILYKSQDYFKLKSAYNHYEHKLSKKYQLYYGALISHVFNQQESSNKFIDELLLTYSEQLNDTLLKNIYKSKLLNHINLYEYKYASNVSEILIEKFEYVIDSAEYNSLKNEYKIWKALSDAPKQRVVINNDTKIDMFRDKVGLMNVSTTFEKDTVNFLFDTGANFSVIISSLAHELELDIIEADFYVTAATGNKVKSKIAIAKQFDISNITIQNAVFLVFEDKDFSFPQIEFYPNGAIGYPVIEALEELHFNKNGSIFVPKVPTNYSYNNMALDGLMPLVAVNYKNDTLNFNLDTGGAATTLYNPFFKKYQTEIESNYELMNLRSSSGGGAKEFVGYKLDSVKFGVADSNVLLKNISLHKEIIFDIPEKIHGNFGQDYIKQFDTMILSFKYSSVVFE